MGLKVFYFGAAAATNSIDRSDRGVLGEQKGGPVADLADGQIYSCAAEGYYLMAADAACLVRCGLKDDGKPLVAGDAAGGVPFVANEKATYYLHAGSVIARGAIA